MTVYTYNLQFQTVALYQSGFSICQPVVATGSSLLFYRLLQGNTIDRTAFIIKWVPVEGLSEEKAAALLSEILLQSPGKKPDLYLCSSSLVSQMVDSFFGFSLYINSSDKRVIFAAEYAYHIAETDFFPFCKAVALRVYDTCIVVLT